MKKSFIKIFIVTLIFVCAGSIFLPKGSWGYMSSPSYINWLDSFNFGGEETSFSPSYRMQDTLGEIGTGPISSTNYAGLIGFRQVDSDPKMTFTISSNLIDFDTLPVGSVVSDSMTVTTTTNAEGGYVTSIYEDGNLRRAGGADINDVLDGDVTAGSEEYGIRTSGAHGQMNGADTAITGTPQAVADYSSWISADTVTINYKVSISITTANGVYGHVVTLVSTGRF